MSPFLIIIGMILAVCILVKPMFGLAITIILMPISTQQTLGGSFLGLFTMTTPIKIIGSITFISTFIHYGGKKEAWGFIKLPQAWFFSLFIVWIFISGLTQPGFATRANFTIFTSIAVLCFIMLVLINDRDRFRLVLWCGIIAIFFVCINAILTRCGIEVSRGPVRLSGASYGSNEFAINLLPFLGLAFCCIFAERHKGLKILATGITCIIVFTLLLTFSRGGIVGLISMLFIAIFKAKNRIIMFFVIAILFIAAINAMPAYMREGMQERIAETEATLQNLDGTVNVDSTKRRYLLAKAAWEMFLEYPLFGVGVGNYYYECRRYEAIYAGRAHNMYLEIMAETGIVGFFLFTGIIWLTLRTLGVMMRLPPPWANYAYGLYIGLIGFLIAALFLHAQHEKALWFIIFMAIVLYRITQYSVISTGKNNIIPKRGIV